VTTIAWRDGVLAADSQITENDRVCGYARKIGQINGVLWGVCGCLIHMVAFGDWVRGGMEGEPPSMKTPEGATSTAIVIAGDRLLTFDHHGQDHMPLPAFHAVGTGAPVALGAMQFGASARQAVEAAIALDVYSGGEITVLRR
jgi:hypothetical protein